MPTPPETQLQLTDDGSATLYLPHLDEHYHSTKGALTESRHIYIAQGLLHTAAQLQPTPTSPLRILEIGFGTGLNAALTLEASTTHHIPIHYTTLELYPLPPSTVAAMGYDHQLPTLPTVNAAPWDTPTTLTPHFTLHKRIADFTADPLPTPVHLVYFDAFAPEKQPDMWTPPCFTRLHAAMTPGANLVTYCAKGSIRRLLQSVGFTVSRLPGPPGGKREILRATKP